MHFDLLQTISLNGSPNTANDDRAGASGALAWVIDGATDLSEPGLLGQQGGAAWLSSAANTAFAGNTAPGLLQTCTQVFAQVETRFHAEKRRDVTAIWEVPSAAFAAVQLVGNAIEVAWAADCAVLLATADGCHWCTPEPNTADEAADALALGPGTGTQSVRTPEVLADRRKSRSRTDRRVLNTDAKASGASSSFNRFPVTNGDHVLLMSDGFSCLINPFARYDAASLVHAVREKGLATLAQEIRQIEREDAACERYPRFKVSDDATALWLRISD
ncbi:MAG: hypothetical protein AB3N23_07040 [Paracoccaceae bacterium]